MEILGCFCFDVLNFARVRFNELFHAQEAWQVVSYTMSFCCLIAWVHQFCGPILKNPTLFGLYRVVRIMPWVERRLKAEMEKVKVEMEEEVHQHDKARDFYKFLPEHRAFIPDILSEAEQYAMMAGGRKAFILAKQNPQESELYSKLFNLFCGMDSSKGDLFPGSRKMEAEVVRMVSSMFHASPDSCGVVAAGASEALMLVCLAYRNASLRRGAANPSVVAPSTAPPILHRAASLLGMHVISISVDENGEYEAAAVRRAINRDVCMVVACAPNPVTGVVDPIEKIAEVTQSCGVPLHVDCSIGGFILPFMEQCDYQLPSYDFRLPGVTSISLDLQEHGQSPSPCSVLLYKDGSFIRDQCFVKGICPGGPYATSTIKENRDGTCIAVGWATLLMNGKDGYLDACQRIVETTRQLTELLTTIDGVVIKGYGDLCLVTFSHDKADIYDVVDYLLKKGWDVDPLLNPVAARIRVSQWFCEEGIVESFVQDVSAAVYRFSEKPQPKRTKLSSRLHMMSSVSDLSLVEDIVFLKLMAHYSISQSAERRTRTLSVEGRKLSMIAAQEAAKLVQEMRNREKTK